MSFKVYKFRDVIEMEIHLNGGLILGRVPLGPGGLVGGTLVFTAPQAKTLTFAPPNEATYTNPFQYIKEQIEGAVSGVRVFLKGDHIFLTLETPSVGSGITITGGTAAGALGVGAGGAKSRVYAYPHGEDLAAPHYVNSFALDNAVTLLVKE